MKFVHEILQFFQIYFISFSKIFFRKCRNVQFLAGPIFKTVSWVDDGKTIQENYFEGKSFLKVFFLFFVMAKTVFKSDKI